MARRLLITTLPRATLENWVESDVVLIHAAFQVLVDFVEKQRPQDVSVIPKLAWKGLPLPKEEREELSGVMDPDANLADWQQIFALYHWWKQNSGSLWGEEGVASAAELKRADDEITAKLYALIALRAHLWT